MTRTFAFLIAAFCFTFLADAQKVKEKDIIGTWKMVIDIEEELEEEAEEADNMLEEVFIKAVSGFVEGIMDDIDIYFEFQKDNELKITVNAYDETETEKGNWYINKRGYLIIENIDDGDDNQFNISSDDDEWKLVDGLLVTDDDDDDGKRNVYLTRVN